MCGRIHRGNDCVGRAGLRERRADDGNNDGNEVKGLLLPCALSPTRPPKCIGGGCVKDRMGGSNHRAANIPSMSSSIAYHPAKNGEGRWKMEDVAWAQVTNVRVRCGWRRKVSCGEPNCKARGDKMGACKRFGGTSDLESGTAKRDTIWNKKTTPRASSGLG